MFKTLKSKFAAVYIGLVIIIGIIGIFATYNTYTLGRQINSLMVRNYKSIKAVNSISQAIDDQNTAALKYININQEEGIRDFHLYEESFNQGYYIEANNITEKGEKELVDELNGSYEKYLIHFSNLQEIRARGDVNSAIVYYKTDMQPEFNHLKKVIGNIAALNENGMFSSKDAVNNYARRFMYVILILSSVSVVIGFLVSMFLLKKFLQPVYSLRETMKAVKEGDLNQRAPIISVDEVGDLTVEFNNMTKRLLQFERSTLGQLLAEKTKSVTIVKSIADPIIVLDTNYRIILLNNACENIFNISEENVLNRHFLEIINNGELYDYISYVNNSNCDDTEHKVIYLNADGKDFYFNIIVSILKNAQDSAAGMVVLFQNITQLKQIEKVKSDFVATVSHEFKTPLTSIMIGISLVKDEKLGVLNERQRKVIDTIAEDSERLLELVNDLLNLSKLESGKSIFDIKSNSIEDIIDKSIKGFAEQAKTKDIYLHYRLEDKLPKVNVDADKITWTLNNLISNALRHTKHKDEIAVNAFVKHNKMCVIVTDTGEGIPKEYQEKIFDKFVQVPGQDSEMRGTGLGLAIAREIIEAHGGEIWCISEFDHGSTFTFTLPIIED